MGLLPGSVAAGLSLCQPFALNHQISFRLATKNRDDAQDIVATLNQNISLKNHRIKDKPLRASCEIHPDRRALYRNAFRAVEFLVARGVAKANFDLCERSLRVYSMPDYALAGSTDSTTKEWIWTPEGKRAFGLEDDITM